MDHVFTLNAIIELYMSKGKPGGKHLYCAFVDYKKAFDGNYWGPLILLGCNGVKLIYHTWRLMTMHLSLCQWTMPTFVVPTNGNPGRHRGWCHSPPKAEHMVKTSGKPESETKAAKPQSRGRQGKDISLVLLGSEHINCGLAISYHRREWWMRTQLVTSRKRLWSKREVLPGEDNIIFDTSCEMCWRELAKKWEK